MNDNKEMAFREFCDMVQKCWTFERMTDKEQALCCSALQFARDQGALRGNFNARWTVLHSIYNAFLSGLGYDGFNWREPEEPLYKNPNF